MSLKRNLSTEKSRKFWEDLENLEIPDREVFTPYLGQAVWDSKYDLSPELLNKEIPK